MVMTWLLVATGFMGAWTVYHAIRWVHGWWVTPFAVKAHFSPKGGCTEAVLHELNRARNEILVQAYSFTSKPIAQALVDAKTRGVHVDIVLDRANEQETYSELSDLLAEGLTLLIDAHHVIAHNTVMIIDGKTVITGSFNFTNEAEHENAENLLIMQGQPDLVRGYRQNFMDHKSHSRPAQVRAEKTSRGKAA